MCEGEFESLRAIHAVSPSFVPEPYAWGKYTQEDPETYFLLAEFRDVGKQVRYLMPAGSSHVYGVKVFLLIVVHCSRVGVRWPVFQVEATRS